MIILYPAHSMSCQIWSSAVHSPLTYSLGPLKMGGKTCCISRVHCLTVEIRYAGGLRVLEAGLVIKAENDWPDGRP